MQARLTINKVSAYMQVAHKAACRDHAHLQGPLMFQPSQQGVLCNLLAQVLYGLWDRLLCQDHEPMHKNNRFRTFGLATREARQLLLL